jgi:hypothetical protein
MQASNICLTNDGFYANINLHCTMLGIYGKMQFFVLWFFVKQTQVFSDWCLRARMCAHACVHFRFCVTSRGRSLTSTCAACVCAGVRNEDIK